MRLFKRLKAGLVRRKGREAELDDELRFHLEKEIEKNRATGMTAEEGRRQALIAFGGVQQSRERVREIGWRNLLDQLRQDFLFSLRLLRKSPGFMVVAVGILALGIGANTAIFSAVNALLFARWPVPHQDQLMLIKELDRTNTGWLVSPPDFEDYRSGQKTFDQISLWVGKSVNFSAGGRPDRLIGAFVSDNFFEMLGVKAAVGRTFLSGEDKPGATPVAVISYQAWRDRFGAETGILGRQVTLNNERYSIIGVLPKDFFLPVSPSDVFLTAQRLDGYGMDRRSRAFLMIGRLKDGVQRSQATADLNTIAQRLAAAYPVQNSGIHIELAGLQELSTQRVRAPLFVLLGAVAMVLLIVCANVANLLLARGTGRQREIAVRSALGAARGRLVCQFLSESMLIAALGGTAGVLLAQALLRWLLTIAPIDVTIGTSAVLDPRVLAFTTGITLMTGALFGVAPALQFSRVNLSGSLSEGSRSAGTASHSWVRSGFVTFQVALSLVLVVGAGLLVESFHALLKTSPGFAPDHLLSMEYRLPPNKYRTSEAQWNFHRQMLARVQQVPGVVSAAIVQTLPFSGNWAQTHLLLPGQPDVNQKDGLAAYYNVVTPEYFSTIGIPLLEGRNFDAHDDQNGEAVTIVSHAFVKKYILNRPAIGQAVVGTESDQLGFASRGGLSKRAVIIGVVGSARQRNVREELQPQIYFSYPQVTGTFGTLVVRTAVDPMSASEAVRQAVWSIDKDQPVWKICTVDSLIAKDTAPDRFAMLLMSALSGLALLLSALGTYGTLSYTVSQRTRELGVRIALGATPASVMRLVLAQGLRLLAIGGLIGIAGALLAGRLISSLLYGVSVHDLTALASGFFAMFLIGLLACWLPARRATKVDPLVALRYE